MNTIYKIPSTENLPGNDYDLDKERYEKDGTVQEERQQ